MTLIQLSKYLKVYLPDGATSILLLRTYSIRRSKVHRRRIAGICRQFPQASLEQVFVQSSALTGNLP